MNFVDVNSNWYCKPGQGGPGEQLNETNVSFERCKKDCVEYNGCHGIDYSNRSHKCRLYGANTFLSDSGVALEYQYCDLDLNDRYSTGFIKLILKLYLS